MRQEGQVVRVRQPKIEEHHVERRRRLADGPFGRPAVGGFQHFVPEIAESLEQRPPDERLVVDDEDFEEVGNFASYQKNSPRPLKPCTRFTSVLVDCQGSPAVAKSRIGPTATMRAERRPKASSLRPVP